MTNFGSDIPVKKFTKHLKMRNFYILLGVAFITTIVLTSYSGDDLDYPSGSPSGYSGSPGDGSDCHNCHGGSASNVSGWITSDIPTSGYIPGSTYTITVSVTGSGNHGFEVSPQNPSGSYLGTLIAGSDSHLVGSGSHWITQNSKKTSNPATWVFQWTAPAAGAGAVTFYGAFCVTKSNTKLSTLTVNEDSQMMATATATPSQICVGQSTQLGVTATGGSGTYTYAWSSIPSGFSSNLQNPTAAPVINTKYIATVNDGSSTITDSVDVVVIPLPTVNAGVDTFSCAGDPEIHIGGSASNFSYVVWSTSGSGIFGDPNSLSTSYFPTAADWTNGFVNVYLTVNGNSPCSQQVSDGKHIDFVICDGIETSDAGAVGIFPNPSNGNFSVIVNSEVSELFIYDLKGQKVYQRSFNRLVGKVNVNLEAVLPGVYLLKAVSKGGITTVKLIVTD